MKMSGTMKCPECGSENMESKLSCNIDFLTIDIEEAGWQKRL
jgi:hypothetical protein